MTHHPQTILEKHCPVFGALFLDKTNKAQMEMFKGIIAAMEEHALQYKTLEQSIRDLWVTACLERDELDEQYKMAIKDRNTCRDMYKETLQERDGWISEASLLQSKVQELTESYQLEQEENIRLVDIGESIVDEVNELKAKISELNGYLEDRHKYIEELENTLGLRNRSNPDLTIDEEKPKSLFERWQNLED
jgi:predicted nuclease with TOPRIM domain